MSSLLYVALGGAIGASARHLLGGAMLRLAGPGFPYGTISANVIGSFLMGVLGFTTFSAFSLDAILMLEKKAYGPFAAYVGGSVLLSLAALMIGLMLARKAFAL